MLTVTERIDTILAARKLSLKKVKAGAENAKKSFEIVEKFETLQARIASTLEWQQLFGAEIVSRIAGLSTSEFRYAFQNYKKEVERLTERFSRKELHVSFIGRAGQGKSLVMQKISGLGGNIIPSAAGSDCTGAKSIITNDSTAVATEAKIEFFSQLEMIEIVNTYLKNIFGDAYRVGSISDIKNLPLDRMKANLPLGATKARDLFPYLENYARHIEKFEGSLGTTVKVPERDIEKYVAQYKSGDTSQKYFNYLGVKLANIICKFPEKDAGKIVLVDTIGIGATSLGTEDEMLKTVENDSDAIVLMFRPDSEGRLTEAERNTVDAVVKKMSPEYTKEMLFWVLNRVTSGRSENAMHIPELMENIKKRNFAVAMVLDVDCSSSEAVASKLLTPILQRLVEKTKKVDELLVGQLNELGEKLYDEYSAIVTAVDEIFVGVASEDVRRHFRPIIKETYDTKILGSLKKLYKDFNKDREAPCEEWEDAYAPALKYIFQSVPKKETVCDLLNRGTINQFNAFEFGTDLMRTRIINRFLELDAALEKFVRAAKMQAVHILADDDKGRLGRLFPLKLSPEEWIDGFIAKTNCANEYPLLAKALMSLKEFTINVEGFLIYEIRRSLDVIDVSLQPNMPAIFAVNGNTEVVAEEIVNILEERAVEVKKGIEKTLTEFCCVPNRAIFAAVKDFYDRAAYAGKDEEKSVTVQWECLYEDWISFVWPEEYNKHFSSRELAKAWTDMLAKFKEQNERGRFLVQ